MTDLPLIPDLDLVRQVHDIEVAYTASRLSVLGRLANNPVGVEIRDLGDGGRFLQARYIPNNHFNRVAGLTDTHAGQLESLARTYAERGIRNAFDVVPGLTPTTVLNELRRLGYGHDRFHTASVGRPRAAPDTAPGVTVEKVTVATLEEFLDCHCRGWGVGDPEGFKANVRGWLTEPGWNLYLARVYDRPAATAILFIQGGQAYCADSACDPEFRGRGAHSALLGRRLEDAGKMGCEIVSAGADFMSTSHRNMLRAGFSTLYTKSVWMKPA